MNWRAQSDGTIARQEQGLSLVYNPKRQRLQVEVTDYHTRPVTIDMAEMRSSAGPMPKRVAPCAPAPEPVAVVRARSTPPVVLLAASLVVGMALGWVMKRQP